MSRTGRMGMEKRYIMRTEPHEQDQMVEEDEEYHAGGPPLRAGQERRWAIGYGLWAIGYGRRV